MKGRSQKQAIIMGDRKVILSRTGDMVFDLAHDGREAAPTSSQTPQGREAIESARRELGRLETVDATPCAY